MENEIIKEFDKKFSGLGADDRLWSKQDDGNWYSVGCEEMKQFILTKLKEERIKTLEEVIKLSDDIEFQHETTFEEWKGFKHFRNTLRDNLKLINNLKN